MHSKFILFALIVAVVVISPSYQSKEDPTLLNRLGSAAVGHSDTTAQKTLSDGWNTLRDSVKTAANTAESSARAGKLPQPGHAGMNQFSG